MFLHSPFCQLCHESNDLWLTSQTAPTAFSLITRSTSAWAKYLCICKEPQVVSLAAVHLQVCMCSKPLIHLWDFSTWKAHNCTFGFCTSFFSAPSNCRELAWLLRLLPLQAWTHLKRWPQAQKSQVTVSEAEQQQWGFTLFLWKHWVPTQWRKQAS